MIDCLPPLRHGKHPLPHVVKCKVGTGDYQFEVECPHEGEDYDALHPELAPCLDHPYGTQCWVAFEAREIGVPDIMDFGVGERGHDMVEVSLPLKVDWRTDGWGEDTETWLIPWIEQDE